jgi:hypothetical protein
MGLLMQASKIGVMAGPVVIGFAVQNGHWPAALSPLLGAAAVLVVAAILLAIHRLMVAHEIGENGCPNRSTRGRSTSNGGAAPSPT